MSLFVHLSLWSAWHDWEQILLFWNVLLMIELFENKLGIMGIFYKEYDISPSFEKARQSEVDINAWKNTIAIAHLKGSKPLMLFPWFLFEMTVICGKFRTSCCPLERLKRTGEWPLQWYYCLNDHHWSGIEHMGNTLTTYRLLII